MADAKITALTALTTPASGDVFPVVDISDTTQAASGTTKKITWDNLFATRTSYYLNGESTGIAYWAGGAFYLQASGANALAVNSGAASIQIASSYVLGWPVGTSDVGLARNAAGTLEINSGTAADFRDLKLRNLYQVVGASSSYTKAAGVLKVDTTQTGNVGAGEDTLQTYSVPANTLAANGDSLSFIVHGTYTASVNTKTLRVKFGASTIIDTGAQPITSGEAWRIVGTITRTGAATQKCEAMFIVQTMAYPITGYVAAAETLSGAVTLLVTGEGTADNDMVKQVFRLDYHPAP